MRHRSFSQAEAPEVEVLVDGQWRFGTLHEWRQDDEGSWSGWVRYSSAPGENRIGVFPADALRPLQRPQAGRRDPDPVTHRNPTDDEG